MAYFSLAKAVRPELWVGRRGQKQTPKNKYTDGIEKGREVEKLREAERKKVVVTKRAWHDDEELRNAGKQQNPSFWITRMWHVITVCYLQTFNYSTSFLLALDMHDIPDFMCIY
jgi:hypothetical protein